MPANAGALDEGCDGNMDGLDFVKNYGGQRIDQYGPQPPLWNDPANNKDEEEEEERINRDYEMAADEWEAVSLNLPANWRPETWTERPLRFIDGKDVGQTIAWLRSPNGYPVPIRLSQIGGIVMRVEDGRCRREFSLVERVVSMVTDVFSWDEIEAFAGALQAAGFRLLSAPFSERIPSYDFEEMRKAAQNKSNTEMGLLEEAALAQAIYTPSIVDGRLEPRAGGIDPALSPAFGVVKTHNKNYLHPLGMQLLDIITIYVITEK